MNCRRRNSSAERPRGGAREQRLGHAGRALEQHVAAERERGEHVLERLVVADDHLAHLARDAGVQLLHGRASLSGFARDERGGQRVDVLHARRRERDVRVFRRPEPATGGPQGDERRERRPSSVHLTRVGRPPKPRERRSRERSPGTRPARSPPASPSPSAALSASASRRLCSADGSAISATFRAAAGVVTTSGAAGGTDHGRAGPSSCQRAALEAAHLATPAVSATGSSVDRLRPPSPPSSGVRRSRRRARGVAASAGHQPAARAHPVADRPRLLRLDTSGSSTISVSPRAAPLGGSSCAAGARDGRRGRAATRTRRARPARSHMTTSAGPWAPARADRSLRGRR